MYLNIKNGSIEINGNTILEDINFLVKNNEKVGVVGRNGSGKTTLLKAITGEYELTDGYDKLVVEKDNFKIGYVSQENTKDESLTLIDYIKDAYKRVVDTEERIKVLESELATRYDEDTLIKYNDLINNYSLIGGYTYKKEYITALTKFGFNEEVYSKKIVEFSGGERTKLSLLKLILSKPDLLILDEPTNHLDIINKETILKLLDSYKGTLIIVSHDRYLIDKVCNKVLLIDNNKATLYNYGYKEYLEKRSNFNEEMVVNKVKSVKKEKKKDNSLAIKEIESEITRLENKVNELNNELLKEEVYMDNIKSRDILNQIDSLKALLDKKISEWEDLNTL